MGGKKGFTETQNFIRWMKAVDSIMTIFPKKSILIIESNYVL